MTLVTQSCLSLWLHRLACQLLCPWNFPGKNTGVGCHSLLQQERVDICKIDILCCTAEMNTTLKINFQKKDLQNVKKKMAQYICYLPETHLRYSDTGRLCVKGQKKAYCQNNQKKSGLALLMSDKVDFKEKKITMDTEHYIIIKEKHSKKTYKA